MAKKESSQANYRIMKQELDQILISLQREDIDIDEALLLHEKGLKLINELELYLKKAGNIVKEIDAKFDSKI